MLKRKGVNYASLLPAFKALARGESRDEAKKKIDSGKGKEELYDSDEETEEVEISFDRFKAFLNDLSVQKEQDEIRVPIVGIEEILNAQVLWNEVYNYVMYGVQDASANYNGDRRNGLMSDLVEAARVTKLLDSETLALVKEFRLQSSGPIESFVYALKVTQEGNAEIVSQMLWIFRLRAFLTMVELVSAGESIEGILEKYLDNEKAHEKLARMLIAPPRDNSGLEKCAQYFEKPIRQLTKGTLASNQVMFRCISEIAQAYGSEAGDLLKIVGWPFRQMQAKGNGNRSFVREKNVLYFPLQSEKDTGRNLRLPEIREYRRVWAMLARYAMQPNDEVRSFILDANVQIVDQLVQLKVPVQSNAEILPENVECYLTF